MKPDLFPEGTSLFADRVRAFAALTILVIAGFGLRVAGLGVEGFSEDELNKLNAVEDYRANGLTAANGEHPMLMKALQTGSIFIFEQWNRFALVGRHPALTASEETALRMPGALFGAFTGILIFLLAAELFGSEVGLVAAALWAFDPNAIGLNRIAKEDTFLLFFFLLANVFWLRGQRVAETKPRQRPEPYYWATAASYGAMMASKYVPQFIGVSISYYWMFQAIPETQWRLGKIRLLKFCLIIVAVFLILSPTIFLPATWREMGIFAGQKRIGHDAYEFMGTLYRHRATDWLNGLPWYFYYVFIAVKLPLLTLGGFLVGLPLLFRRRLGDGRYFILMWMFVFIMTFSFVGGKFTRYLTILLPAILIAAAIGVQFVGKWLARGLACWRIGEGTKAYTSAALAAVVIFGSLRAAVSTGPHYRLFTNHLGGGSTKAGYFFPHDEFYDSSMRDAIFEIAKRAKPGVRVASETPRLASYYAGQAHRSDLVCVPLSDLNTTKDLGLGDFVVIARGRRYFSNDQLITRIRQSAFPSFQTSLGRVLSAEIYEYRDR